MKRLIAILIALTFFICGLNYAQDNSSDELNLPSMTLEQKMDRLMLNTAGMIANSIGYIKSIGGSAAGLGEYVGNVFSKGWSSLKGATPKIFVETMYKNYQSDPDNKFEVVEVTDNSVTYKTNRFLGSKMNYYLSDKVTQQDIDDCYEKLIETIANSLGLQYSQKIESDGVVITISK